MTKGPFNYVDCSNIVYAMQLPSYPSVFSYHHLFVIAKVTNGNIKGIDFLSIFGGASLTLFIGTNCD